MQAEALMKERGPTTEGGERRGAASGPRDKLPMNEGKAVHAATDEGEATLATPDSAVRLSKQGQLRAGCEV